MMRNWPRGFSDLVTPKVAGRAERHRDGNRGETIRFLKTGQSSILSAALAGIIGDLRNEFDLRGEKAEEIAQGVLPIKTVGRILGMGTAAAAVGRPIAAFPGGVVCRDVGGNLVAAIGVSGAASDEDEHCSITAARAIGLSTEPAQSRLA